MQKFISVILVIGAFLCFSSTTVEYTHADTPPPSTSDLIAMYAGMYNVPESTLKNVISCESSFQNTAHRKTVKEDSYGLVQINLLAHPDISKADAQDPSFSINYLAQNIAKGNLKQMWYICSRKKVEEKTLS